MQQTPRPVYFGFGIPSGGVPAFARQLAATLRRSGAREIRFFAPLAGYKSCERAFGLNEWKFALLSLLRMGPARFFGRALVHLHTRSLLVPDVFTVHGLYCNEWHKKLKRSRVGQFHFAALSWVERRLIRRARRVVFVSRDNREYAEKRLGIRRPESFRVINPAVDCEKFSPVLRGGLAENRRKRFPMLDPSARWMIFVGIDFRRKGLFRLLEALERQREGSPSWALLVFGSDPAELGEAQAVAARLGGRVAFFDRGAPLHEAFGLSDVFVMASEAEGYPAVLLEAMAAGCIPFVTRFDGTSEAILEGKTGFAFDDADHVIQEALRVPHSRLREMQPAARAFALEHTWERVAREYEQLYRELERV